MNNQNNISEELFTSLCSQYYLKGFVFHSPKYLDPTEKEIGDVVLWVRSYLIVFEIVWRNVNASGNTKHFIKRIGRKRDQLVNDFKIFGDTKTHIKMLNEAGEELSYDHQCFEKNGFCGVVIVDSNKPLTNLHFETFKKSLDQDFPIAILTKRDFLDLLAEIDTVPDLRYYLIDRTKFLREVFKNNAATFLDLNKRSERNLIAYYKMHNNKFPLNEWQSNSSHDYWINYQQNFAHQIDAREVENNESLILDEITDLLRSSNSPNDSTLLHSWELAVLPRRVRAGILANKIEEAFNQMEQGRKRRHFAFLNPVTRCWILFYFQHGGNVENFKQIARQLTQMKMRVERVEQNFEYSVFCYAFRKSFIITKNTFDNVVLLIEDAENYQTITDEDYKKAKQFFAGITEKQEIREFP